MPDYADLEARARRIRANVVRMAHRGKEGHLQGALSCVDILTALYGGWLRGKPGDPERDRLYFSKGHACAALYATWAEFGLIDPALLETYAQPGSPLTSHPDKGLMLLLEMSAGSLGHGLGYAAGAAYGLRLRGSEARCVALLSDGECNEGSVWEAAMFAAAQGLGNLTCIVDANGMQSVATHRAVNGKTSLARKFEACGWVTQEVNGHDFSSLHFGLSSRRRGHGVPFAIIAHTTPGKGVSFMEQSPDALWHYRVPSDEDLAAALKELAA